jgi:hypothetical protein
MKKEKWMESLDQYRKHGDSGKKQKNRKFKKRTSEYERGIEALKKFKKFK